MTVAAGTASRLHATLGRDEHLTLEDMALERLAGLQVLVTGAHGSVGKALVDLLANSDATVIPTDQDTLDVTKPFAQATWSQINPGVIVHLAAEKLAPRGEEHPFECAHTNIVGTQNMVERPGCRVVLASTCKAADPETAYGASKLIAERIVLNAGGTVARLYNILGSADDVFQVWDSLPASAPLPVTPCSRRWITMREAVALLAWSITLPAGRYTVSGTVSRHLSDVATGSYPGREVEQVPPRRGDRWEEPRWAGAEIGRVCEVPWITRVVNPCDPPVIA